MITDEEIKKYYLIGREDEKNDTSTKMPNEQAELAYECGTTDEREEISAPTGNYSWDDVIEFIKEEIEEIEEIEEGTWVKLKNGLDRPVRYVSKLNSDGKTFTDDGKDSKQSPSPSCYLNHYENIN